MALPTEMNAWVAKMGHREPFRSRVPVPDVASDGLLVQVEAMDVCHSDCSLLQLDEPIYHMKREYSTYPSLSPFPAYFFLLLLFVRQYPQRMEHSAANLATQS